MSQKTAVKPDQSQSDAGMRLNKYFTEHGIMSRREADRCIAAGRIQINGKVATLGHRVMDGDIVSLDGNEVEVDDKTPVIIAYHKPIGIECTSSKEVKENIIDAVNYPARVVAIGRLDKMSEGLILLTNMGEIVTKILRARFQHEKEYRVSLDRRLDEADIEKLARGIKLEDGVTSPCKTWRINTRSFGMVLTEGRNRQIRRMVDHLGYKVSRLMRVRVMDIQLGELPVGKWRKLDKGEVSTLLGRLAQDA